jgi:site-specific recombinase XerC
LTTTLRTRRAYQSFLGFAHRVGFTRLNAGPLIKLKKAPRQIAQRILSEVQIALLIRAAKTDRDRLIFDLAYFGGMRVSELVSFTWGQVIRRDSGEAQLSIIGKGSKSRGGADPRGHRRPTLYQPWRYAGLCARVPVRSAAEQPTHGACRQLHRQRGGRARPA